MSAREINNFVLAERINYRSNRLVKPRTPVILVVANSRVVNCEARAAFNGVWTPVAYVCHFQKIRVPPPKREKPLDYNRRYCSIISSDNRTLRERTPDSRLASLRGEFDARY
ncbi:unnamed protein product [Lasius platythorax]|uniref:Uncharacterized protein n=1 Tax=Lasius platythorax TaxID=488582 RepID=A0AAV2N418_9HYME